MVVALGDRQVCISACGDQVEAVYHDGGVEVARGSCRSELCEGLHLMIGFDFEILCWQVVAELQVFCYLLL